VLRCTHIACLVTNVCCGRRSRVLQRIATQCRLLSTNMQPWRQPGAVPWRLVLTKTVTWKFYKAVLFFWWQIRGYALSTFNSRVSNPLVSWHRSFKVLAQPYSENLQVFTYVTFYIAWHSINIRMSLTNLKDMKIICSWIRSAGPQTFFLITVYLTLKYQHDLRLSLRI
jgi:hypothetical protein